MEKERNLQREKIMANNNEENSKIDSTEEPIPEDITLEELQKDQHRKISAEDRADSDEYIKKAGLDADAEEHS